MITAFKMQSRFMFLVLTILIVSFTGQTFAQTEATQESIQEQPTIEQENDPIEISAPVYEETAPDPLPEQEQPPQEATAEESTETSLLDAGHSLFFTRWELLAIQDAINLRGVVRPVSETELQASLAVEPEPRPRPPPEARFVTLNGIVYNSRQDWTIWLNGKRITPDALPREAIDLKVYREFIEVEWYDDYTDKIFPIRLRANQRFNIDTRIFLPG